MLRWKIPILILLVVTSIQCTHGDDGRDSATAWLLGLNVDPLKISDPTDMDVSISLLVAGGSDLIEAPMGWMLSPSGNFYLNLSFVRISIDPDKELYVCNTALPFFEAGTWTIDKITFKKADGLQETVTDDGLEAMGFLPRILVTLPANTTTYWKESMNVTPISSNTGTRGSFFSQTSLNNGYTGSTMQEEYSYANRINHQRTILMDNQGSSMETETSFSGQGHIGVTKDKDDDQSLNLFASSEDYTGDFKIQEKVDAYGKNVQTESKTSGEGLAYVDRRILDNQRSYQSGSGSYESEEFIDTQTGYMAKDIRADFAPTSFNYSPSVNVNFNDLWSEGTITRSEKKDETSSNVHTGLNGYSTSIGENEFEAEFLEKSAIIRGTKNMTSSLNFSGIGEFQAAMEGTSGQNVAVDEMYIGEFETARNVELNQRTVSGSPNLLVYKEGNLVRSWIDDEERVLGRYRIILKNNGWKTLEPVYVRDVFPDGAVYLNSSLRPSQLTGNFVNWTLTHMSPGDVSVIDLFLILDDSKNSGWINQVYASGAYDKSWETASNFSILQEGWLDCCPAKAYIRQEAIKDPDNPSMVTIRISLQNSVGVTAAFRVTDYTPSYLVPISFNIQPAEYTAGHVLWNFPNVEPGQSITIEYKAVAKRDGAVSCRAHLEMETPFGKATSDASDSVVIEGTGKEPYTTRYGGWQPPNWNQTSSDEGLYL